MVPSVLACNTWNRLDVLQNPGWTLHWTPSVGDFQEHSLIVSFESALLPHVVQLKSLGVAPHKKGASDFGIPSWKGSQKNCLVYEV